MIRTNMTVLLVMATLTGAAAFTAEAEDIVQKTAQDLVADYGDAVINITAVLKTSVSGSMAAMMGGGGKNESKVESLATIIDASGLAVLSEASLNNTVLMPDMELDIGMGGGAQTLSFSGDLSEVKYRLADGTEVPARIVLKDEDLDLAFIAPEKELDEETRAKFKVVSLAKKANTPDLMSRFIALGRADKSMHYEVTAMANRIQAVITKPRTFYLGMAKPGSPVFDEQGAFLGISAIRRAGKPAMQKMGMASAGSPTMLQSTMVIIPVEDIESLLKQAKEEIKKSAE